MCKALLLSTSFFYTCGVWASEDLPFVNPAQLAAPAPASVPVRIAPPVQAAVPVRAPVPIEPQAIFNAVDSGDVAKVQAQVSSARASYQNILELRDANGNTLLIRAAIMKKTDVANYLVSEGANINAQNIQGQTALTVSYNNGEYAEAKYLLSKGASDSYNVSGLLNEVEAQGHLQTDTLLSVAEYGGAAAVVAGAAAAAAGGGGGGSGGGGSATPPAGVINPQNLDPASFVTAEGQLQLGVLAMNTQFALARGYDGRIYSRNSNGTLASYTPTGNVKVAVVDTGIDLTQTELTPNLLTADSVTCNNSGCVSGGTDTSSDGHGTFVAGIIGAQLNGIGMYGVAPQSKIMSIGFADNTGTLTNGDIPGIQSALTNGAQVLNGSYGFPNSYLGGSSAFNAAQVQALVNSTVAGTNYATQFQRGVLQHAIFVYAAGNDGPGAANPSYPAALPYYFQGATAPAGVTQSNYDLVNPNHYDWSKNWVAAVSVTYNSGTGSYQLSSFSNACGIAASWCLAAPGESTVSTAKGGGLATGSGTSFAAPNITGAIADMLGAFPQLSPEKALQILFSTATPLGSSAVYGYGLINLEKATSPSDGGWSLTSIGSITPYSFYTSGLGLSAPFGNALHTSNAHLQFLDSYGKNYTIPLSAVAQNLTPAITLQTKFAEFGEANFDTVTRLSANAQLGFSAALPQQDIDQKNPNPYGKFSYHYAMPIGSDTENTTFFALNYQSNLADALTDVDQKRFTVSDAFKNPYLNLVDAANSSVVGLESGASRGSLAMYSGNYTNEYLYRFNDDRSVNGAVAQYKYTGSDMQSNVALEGGVSIEKNGFLGSEASGAFAVDKSSTYYTGVSGKYAVTDNLSLIGNYYMGVTRVSSGQGSLFTGFNTIATNAFAAGTEYTGLRQDNDSLSFIISQPLRVTSGGANLLLPTGVAANGDNLYSSNSLNLSPSGRELDLETNYNIKFDENNALDVSVLFRSNPNNGTSPNSDTAVLGKYALGF